MHQLYIQQGYSLRSFILLDLIVLYMYVTYII